MSWRTVALVFFNQALAWSTSVAAFCVDDFAAYGFGTDTAKVNRTLQTEVMEHVRIPTVHHQELCSARTSRAVHDSFTSELMSTPGRGLEPAV